MKILNRLTISIWSLTAALSAVAQVNSHSDGSDGALNPSATTTTIDLGLATTAAWTVPGGGNGVYDGAKWAVVFKYSSVTIDPGETVKFTNHPKNPPVVWLVQGDVTINGTLSLDALLTTNDGALGVPGPGGFRGGSNEGSGVSRGGGYGPGGSRAVPAFNHGYGGSYGTQPVTGNSNVGPIYGNAAIIPLLGGSGGASYSSFAGGAGGGAILIVASGRITVNGVIRGVGSQHAGLAGGSGGAIRLVANEVVGTGQLNASGPTTTAGMGRIRVERLSTATSFTGTALPAASSTVLGGPEPTIWPTTTHPTVNVFSVAGVAVPADPASSFGTPDVTVGPAATYVVRVEAANVPTDGSWVVQVRVVPRSGQDTFANATLISGNQVASVWEATVTLPQGGSAVIARAYRQ
ncbi:MAG: hypothetical protein K1X67_04995 [Fimbriimonadaceae bacterium]|nr:hypothetical protein [Fimbriimonadaceae bacterium]